MPTLNKDLSLAEGFLRTDQYQLTMAQMYFKLGFHEETVQFDHFFRQYPDYGSHQVGYCINAGLEWLIRWLQDTRITREDIACLRNHHTPSGERVFDENFLDWLCERGSFGHLTIRAIPEGRVIHPDEPVTSVQGPLALCQILETPLLNQLNYQILTATKACRVKASARGRPVLEFGIRRAQERGGIAGARAALIGGADFTSNVGISHVMDLPPKGTHAHSMVQFFLAMGMEEIDAFRAYADVYPDNCILLVDTINTLQSGVPNAIKVFEELRQKGHQPRGVRLDSGDLAHLAMETHNMLNEAGFEDAWIVLSNELDELVIWQITEEITREAPGRGIDPDDLLNRLVYGVGTHLITSWGSPALSAAYKLVAVYREHEWRPVLKISESRTKIPNPGFKNLWRIYNGRGKATADLMTAGDEDPDAENELTLHHPADPHKTRNLAENEIQDVEMLLCDIVRDGELVYDLPDLNAIRTAREHDLGRLDSGVKRLLNPHEYHVSISQRLWEIKEKLIQKTAY